MIYMLLIFSTLSRLLASYTMHTIKNRYKCYHWEQLGLELTARMPTLTVNALSTDHHSISPGK